MMRAGQWAFITAVLVAAPAAMADGGECSFGGRKLASDCTALGWQKTGDFFIGCCSDTSLIWCENDGSALCAFTCADNKSEKQTCGWSEEGSFYDCSDAATPDPAGTNPLACAPTCTPQCDGKTCGYDGCAGFCGTCGEGTFCSETGTCDACSCDGKTCGLDQCGKSCGECSNTEYCKDSQCNACSCDGKECGSDECGKACGTCTGGKGCDAAGLCVDLAPGCAETTTPACSGCKPEDQQCVCSEYDGCCTAEWDYYCVYLLEQCTNTECACVPDCTGKACGSDGCGGTCGACADGQACAGAGVKCLPCSCDAKTCGVNACGVECGKCADGEACVGNQCKAGQCAPNPNGDKGCPGCACEACVCAADPYCCDTQWDSQCAGECAQDCNGDCGACAPDCELKECGDNGCGADCGTCGGGQKCDPDGLCCTPKCDGKTCGGDGCGGECGTCQEGFVCEAGNCAVCQPQCDGKTCGDNGCGGTCGECAANELCSGDGTCGAPYPVSCLGPSEPSAETCPETLVNEGCCDDSTRVVYCDGGKLYCVECGSDGEKGTCGWDTAAAYYDCGLEGPDPDGNFPLACAACTPSCTDKECGSDGCGGTCGSCAAGKLCGAAGRCEEAPVVGADTTSGGGDDAGTTDGPDAATSGGDTATPGADTAGGGADTTGGTGGTTSPSKGSSSGCQTTDRGQTLAGLIAGLALAALALARRRSQVK